MNRVFAFDLRTLAGLNWVIFFAGIILAWIILFLMSASVGQDEFTSLYGAQFWAELCQTSVLQAGYLGLFVMWALMTAAMMAPTLVPALKTFSDLTHTSAASSQSFAALIFGYLLVWLGFAGLAAGVQLVLVQGAYVSVTGSSLSWALSAGLLLAAGLYQFSALKEVCLNQCRAPLTFFFAYFEESRWGAVKMGVRLGVICLGCCWALMALAFVGGTMNLIWMGLATVIMVSEKLPDLGKYITRPLGGALLLGAAYAGFNAIF